MPGNTTFPARRWYLGLAGALVLFTLYGSLIPFRWRPTTLVDAWHEFSRLVLDVPPGRISRTDFLANILLFVPLGFSLSGALLAQRHRRRAALLVPVAVLAAGVALSVIAEFLQTFTAGRVPTHRDIAAQTIGCSVGIAVWFLVGDSLTGWIRSSLATTGTDRRWRVLAAVVIAWVLVSLAPFDITLDVGDFARRVRSGRIVLIPFTDPGFTTWRRIWDMVAEVLGAIPLGLLLAGRTRGHSTMTRIARGAAIVVAIEGAQVFLRSHTASATDALLGTLGVTAGVLAGHSYLRERDADDSLPARGVSAPAAAAAIVWLLVLAFYHWQPFDFVVNAQAIKHKLAQQSLLPFATYAAGSPINALNDVLRKLALALPLGAIAVLVPRRRRPLTTTMSACWVAGATAVFALVELGQLFLPSRFPDVTDVWVGVAGFLVGAIVSHWMRGDVPPA